MSSPKKGQFEKSIKNEKYENIRIDLTKLKIQKELKKLTEHRKN